MSLSKNFLKATCFSIATFGAVAVVTTMAMPDVAYAKSDKASKKSKGKSGKGNSATKGKPSAKRGNSGGGDSIEQMMTRKSSAGKKKKTSKGKPFKIKGTPHAGKPAHVAKPKNVHAQLKGLNSLNRNINGLMNSSDPKMDQFREFVVAGAEYDSALDALADALLDFDLTEEEAILLEDLGLDAPTTEEEFEALREELEALASAPEPDQSDYTDEEALAADHETWTTSEPDPADFPTDEEYLSALGEWSADEPVAADYPDEDAFATAHSEWDASTSDATAALDGYVDDYDTGVSDAETDVAVAEEEISEEALIEAMVAGLNATGAGPVEGDDMTDEMIDWVSGQVGVTYDEFGDVEISDGFIEDYIGMQEPDEAALLDPAPEDETEVVTELVDD